MNAPSHMPESLFKEGVGVDHDGTQSLATAYVPFAQSIRNSLNIKARQRPRSVRRQILLSKTIVTSSREREKLV